MQQTITDKDILIIVDKGFELAKNLLDPDTFHSIGVLQSEKKYGPLTYYKGKLTLKTNSKTLEINPDKVTEQGVAICKSKKGDIFFAEGGRQGLAMAIRPELCTDRGVYIGSLHTHPGGSPAPSMSAVGGLSGDLVASSHNNDQIMCIASKLSRKELAVNCYIPKTEFIVEDFIKLGQTQDEIMHRWISDEQNPPLLMDIKEEKDAFIKTARALGYAINEKDIITRVPLFDQRKTPWFTSSMLEDTGEYYTIKKFRKMIE